MTVTPYWAATIIMLLELCSEKEGRYLEHILRSVTAIHTSQHHASMYMQLTFAESEL